MGMRKPHVKQNRRTGSEGGISGSKRSLCRDRHLRDTLAHAPRQIGFFQGNALLTESRIRRVASGGTDVGIRLVSDVRKVVRIPSGIRTAFVLPLKTKI